ncbi:MAG: hypothetical protein CK604_06220 [Curvibacter sp. PD_MW3]|nr:MAG: hypothetical protein CK604_06220 [Curvibacter sp. PD_MW3]
MKINEIIPPYLDEVFIPDQDLRGYQSLREGKFVPGRFPSNLRIDQATHLQGNAPPHAHVFGRKGDELGVVNQDGSGSHGSKFRLHQKDADALRSQGFNIRPDNIVEWIALAGIGSARQILLG